MKPIQMFPYESAGDSAEMKEKINILLVDDQPANLLALEALLAQKDYALVRAASGQEALRCVREQEFALILLDVLMPGMDGFETAKLIRQHQQSTHTPIIFITAMGNSEDHVSRGYSLGAVDYIYKPIVIEILKAKVAVFAEIYATRKHVEAEQKLLDQRLREQQFYTRSLIESNIDATMTTDPSGIITDVNRQMQTLTGCTRDEMIGASFESYFTDPEQAAAAIQLVLNKKRITDYELTVSARDGKKTVVSYNATTFYDRDRKLLGVFAVARDVTEHKRMNQVQQETLASKYESRFLANISHQLRAPLNGMLNLARILGNNADANLTAKQVESAKTIYAAGSDLLSLINDSLDLSRIELGVTSIEVGEVGFRELRDYVERGFRQIAEQKGLDFSIELDPSLPTAIITDSKRLEQVLQNLLANSFKFTERGKVSLRMGVAKDGWRPGHQVLDGAKTVLSFRVSDTGIGIPADKQDIIFEAFQQADMTTGLKLGGTGLGLTLSRAIAKLLGGDIHMKSGEQGGAVFTLFLPASYAPIERH